MTDDRWDQIEQLLEEVLARPAAERAAFLEAACDDAALREEVAALAEAYEEADGLFDDVASAVAGLALSALQEDEREQDETDQGASDPLELEGKRVQRYAIEAYLGGGGMGVVCRARDTKLGRPVALKFLPSHLSRSDEAEQRFIREAKAASALDHPNIGTIHEISETKTDVGRARVGQRYIAMAYYAGETLKAKIARGPLPIEEALDYATQIAEGLARAHAAGIVHRDVKPANVMVTEEGAVKLVDFGLARAAGQSDLTRTGQTLGTVAYMSPEQARGAAIDSRTDLWALGAVLYEMLTGARPFRGRRPEAVIYAILNEEPEPLSALRPEASSALADVVARCLAKDPAERYPNAGALHDDLRAILDGRKPLARPWYGHISMSNPIHLAITAVLILGALSWALWPSGPGPIDSIAVLPLTSPSGNPEEEYFSFGMTEALTAELGQIGALKVISPSSAFQYEGASTPLTRIAQELGVGALVQGSVFQADGRVRITVHLVQGSSGEQLWSESFEQEYQDVLALQREVAHAVAEEVQVTLAPEEAARLANPRPVHPEAHRQWLIGNYHLTMQDEATFRKALDAYQEAIDIDPGYAQAYAGMALAYLGLGGWWSTVKPTEIMPRAKEAAHRALALDSTVAEAHIALARVRQVHEWDWAGADRAYRRGITLNPSATHARILYANYLTAMGRFEESIEVGRETVELDPLSPAAYNELAFALDLAGRMEEAVEVYHEALELDPEFLQTRILLALHHLKQGNSEEGLEHFSAIEKMLEEGSPRQVAYGGYVLARAGEREEARDVLSQLLEQRKTQRVPASALADVYLGLNAHPQPLKWLETAYHERDISLQWIKAFWIYDPLRSNPRFQDLLEQMDFPASQVAKEESEGRRADLLSTRDGMGERRVDTAELLSGPSVVVLPLENLSGDSTQAYFADGMTGAIIANLARIEALHVISRTTAMHYKGSDAPLPVIASRLDVRYVVDGAVFSTADSVRITASLVEAAADRTLWTRAFTREMRGILGLQRAVARAVAEGIEVELSPETEARMAQAPEVDPAAYRHYQRGVQIRVEQAAGTWRQAREHFKRAVAVDSSFALAWAWLAKMHAILGTTRTRAEEDLKAKAEEAIEKALVLDSDLAEAYVALGLTREVLDLDGAGAERAFRQALELEPGSQEARHEYGLLLMRMGRMGEALVEMKRAQDIDPLSMHVQHGLIKTYINSRQFEQAIQQARRALEIEPGHRHITGSLARAYVHAGRFEEAEATYRRYDAIRGDWEYEASFWEAYLHAKKGQPDKARAWMEAGDNLFGDAWLHAALGEIKPALDALDEAYRTWPSRWSFIFLKIAPPYDPLRGEPRFQALVEKTRLG